ncbi:MAG: hypothetical protein AAF914_11115 [Pseudomonadota bacterium]
MTPITLHIGMNKTGTSALQAALFRNRRALLRAGLHYPETGLGARSEGAGLHYRLSAAFLAGGAEGPALAGKLLRDIDEVGARHAFISSEFFVELRDVGPLAAAFAGRDVRILVYLRRHDHWMASLFAQAVKTQARPPWGPSVDAFIDHARKNLAHYYRYSTLLGRWAEAFGDAAMDVRVYGPGATTDIVADALRGLDVPEGAMRGSSPRVNGAPSRRQLAAIDHVQRAPIAAPVRRRLVQAILAQDDTEKPRRLMTAATAQDLLDEHAEDYAAIARMFLGRHDGVLFHEPPPAPGGPERIALWPGEGITVMTELLSQSLAA